MNSSAKTTTITFLAAAALGAAVFMGCTVTSGTVDDTDGGTNNNNNNKDGGSQNETGTDTDSGGGETCNNAAQTSKFEPAACQTCMESKCCLELTNCFNIPEDTANGKLGCNGFKDCLDDCVKPHGDGGAKTQDEIDACNNECADTLAADGVVTAWGSIVACSDQGCAAECAPE